MDYPVTPPQSLLKKWLEEAMEQELVAYALAEYIATKAARWGADQELEACCSFLDEELGAELSRAAGSDCLRHARRPKPPSLKQQALSLLPDRPGGIAMKFTLHPDDIELL